MPEPDEKWSFPIRCWLILWLGVFACNFPVFAGIAPSKEDIVLIVESTPRMQQAGAASTLGKSVEKFLAGMNRDLQVSLLVFDDNPSLKVPFVPVADGGIVQVMQGLEDIDYQGRFSNSAAAIERALYELEENGRQGGARSIILIGQGRINSGNEAADLNFSRWLESVLAEQAQEAGVRIFCISVAGEGETSVFETLTRKTGGRLFSLEQSNGLGDIFGDISQEIFATGQW